MRDHSYMQTHAAFGRARPFNVSPPGFTQRPNSEVMEAGAAKERRHQREASGCTVQCVAVSCGWDYAGAGRGALSQRAGSLSACSRSPQIPLKLLIPDFWPR